MPQEDTKFIVFMRSGVDEATNAISFNQLILLFLTKIFPKETSETNLMWSKTFKRPGLYRPKKRKWKLILPSFCMKIK